MKILVVDDILENRLVLDRLLNRMGHHVVTAENGKEAVERFPLEKPDLVLMDIMMPVMNGLEAIAAIRELLGDAWVPIFVVSALHDTNDVVQGLKAGADDYLPKPIDRAILSAKIASIERTLSMQRRIVEDSEQLRRYHEENERERDFLDAIFERLIRASDVQSDELHYWLRPAQHFSGDLVCAHRVDKQRICFMLADSTGHGLAAALPTVLVNQVFRGMAKKALPISIIAREINQQLHCQLPPGRFVALALGMVDMAERRIELWNGGLPDVLVLDRQGAVLKAFASRHTFAGVMHDKDFDDSSEIWQWDSECELFAYSDGIADAKNPAQQAFGGQRLMEILSQASLGEKVGAIRQALETFVDGEEDQDDMSCVALRCGIASDSAAER